MDREVSPFPDNEAKGHLSNRENRSILISNLAPTATLKDVVNVVRGGAILEIYFRPAEKVISVSFVDSAAAVAFVDYSKRSDIYVCNKRVCDHDA